MRLSLHAVAEEPPTHPEPASSSQSSHRCTSTEVLLARHQPSRIGRSCSRRPLSEQLSSLTPATSSQSLQSPAPCTSPSALRVNMPRSQMQSLMEVEPGLAVVARGGHLMQVSCEVRSSAGLLMLA